MDLIGESTGPAIIHSCNHGHLLAIPDGLSDPLPPEAIPSIQIGVDAMDTGCFDGHDHSCGTWFEMSVLRRVAGDQSRPLASHSGALDLSKTNHVYVEPKDCKDDFEAQRWTFVPVPVPTGRFVCRHVDEFLTEHSPEEDPERPGNEPDVSICIFRDAVSEDWILSTRRLTIKEPRWFEEGDRLVIWANAAISKDLVILFSKKMKTRKAT